MNLQSTAPNIKARYVLVESIVDKALFKVLDSNFTTIIVVAYSVALLWLGSKL